MSYVFDVCFQISFTKLLGTQILPIAPDTGIHLHFSNRMLEIYFLERVKQHVCFSGHQLLVGSCSSSHNVSGLWSQDLILQEED